MHRSFRHVLFAVLVLCAAGCLAVLLPRAEATAPRSTAAFVHVDYDGTMLASSGVVGVTRLGGTVAPRGYVLELARAVDPLRTHVTASCRATTTAPAERFNVAFVDGTHVAVVWLGELGSPPGGADMAFTVAVEEHR